ncbi:MAG: nuclear transport factor 2 family protein [Candidatus Sulfomarinibacteraceae bacterium]
MRSTQVLLSLFAVILAFAGGSIHAEGDRVPTDAAANAIERPAGEAGEENGAPPETDEEEVRRIIEYAIGWAVDKDFDRMFSIWAHDENLYHHWLSSTSTTRGFAEFEAHAESWRDPRFKGTTYEFRDLEITFSKSGDVAWYSCRLDDCYEFDGRPGCVENVLQTGVLEKRDGRWVHVLMHGSYPVDEVPLATVERYYGDALAGQAETSREE